MPSAIELTGDVASASAALAGLILVFLGAIGTSFDSYQKQEQKAVKGRYQKRAWFAFVGLALALLAILLALIGKWTKIEWAAVASLFLLFISLVWVLLAALSAVREIK